METDTPYAIDLILRLAETKLTGTTGGATLERIPGRSALLSIRLLVHRTKNHAGRKLTESLIGGYRVYDQLEPIFRLSALRFRCSYLKNAP